MLKMSKKQNFTTKIMRVVYALVANSTFWTGVCVVGTIFFGAALISYSPHDACIFNYASDAIANWCSWQGAELAAVVIYFFGISGWLIFVCCAYYSYQRLRGVVCGGMVLDRIIALFMLPFVMSVLCSWYRIELYEMAVPGGLFGGVVHRVLVHTFDWVGALVILHALLFALLALLAPYATLRMIKLLLAFFAMLFSWKTAYFLMHVVRISCFWLLRLLAKVWRGFLRIMGGTASVVHDAEDAVSVECVDMADNQVSDTVFWQQYLARGGTMETASIITAATVTDVAMQEASEKFKQAENLGSMRGAQQNATHSTEQGTTTELLAATRYQRPSTALFSEPKRSGENERTHILRERATILEQKLECFGVMGCVTAIKEGPAVTLFEYEPRHDTKLSRIMALEDDLAMALQAMSIRIIAPIPGRSVVGFEVANKKRVDVLFASIVHSKEFQDFCGTIPLILGQDTVGNTVVVDLAKMPHLLVAGSTGSGKSVALNAMLVSMLCTVTPDELKLILIDPKRLEFAPYADIPHLLFPIVTDPRKASPVLAWVVRTMEERYEEMARHGARSVADYNRNCADHSKNPMATIVVVIDELADLMMTAPREVEDLIARIAQMARAAGIHLLVATQRPSVDVITGLIKVNFPSRISFRVTSKVDSRTILDLSGAEKLLGRGDMLFLDSARAQLIRVHGAYVSDKEIASVVAHVKAQRTVKYLDVADELTIDTKNDDPHDQLYQEVLTFVRQCDEVSISLLQRRFRIGFNRSARLIESLETQGLIMPCENGKTRKVIR